MSGALKVNERVDTILCDIEGTTTSISFVKDTLFPYVRKNLKNYLHQNFDNKECQEDIALHVEQYAQDLKTLKNEKIPAINIDIDNRDAIIDSLCANVFWQMDNDRKARPLKQLQGHMWTRAYESGEICGHVYDDVVPSFEKWTNNGAKKVYIYSSGSIEAQKLLFKYSCKGDLTKFISGNFDTTIGLKQEMHSYENILKALNKTSDQILFLTDMIREVKAATSVGIQTCLLRREDNPDKELLNKCPWVSDFTQILF